MTSLQSAIRPSDWIRGETFDTVFIFGLLVMAVVTGLTVTFLPHLFYPVLILDLWFLGYHHVIATYTRLCFDKQSFAEQKGMIFWLLPAVAGVTLAAVWQFGLWIVVSVYFYWQWWHYTRQSWGISRTYRGKRRDGLYEDGWLDQTIFYAVPVAGILKRSNEGDQLFIGMQLKVIPVADAVVSIAFAAMGALLLYWLFRRYQAWREGRLPLVHTFYMISHFAIFAIGYWLVPNITIGWLMINIWHNAQYILFVWVFNNRRFREGVDPGAKFLSYISQPGRLGLYLAVCLAITGAIYWGVIRTMDWLFFAGLSATIVLYQIVNFHHYVVDSLIWKMRKPAVGGTMGLKS